MTVDPAKLARLEKLERSRMDTAVQRALAELDRAHEFWVMWADCVRQRREHVLGNDLGEPRDPVLDDREYGAALDRRTPINDARAVLRRYLEEGGKR